MHLNLKLYDSHNNTSGKSIPLIIFVQQQLIPGEDFVYYYRKLVVSRRLNYLYKN